MKADLVRKPKIIMYGNVLLANTTSSEENNVFAFSVLLLQSEILELRALFSFLGTNIKTSDQFIQILVHPKGVRECNLSLRWI